MGQIQKKYPLYKVVTNYPVTLSNYNGQSFNILAGTFGTFQARPEPILGTTNPNQPDPIIIDAKFNGQTITFRPKFYVPNGDIKPLLLRHDKGLPDFKILETVYPSYNQPKTYSSFDSDDSSYENDEAITTLNNPDDLGIYSNADANTAKRFLVQRPTKALVGKTELVSKEPIENTIIEDKKESTSSSKVASSIDEDKILGMPKNVAYVAGVALVIIGGFFVYKKFIKK